jgi:hypothetical protein
MNPPFHLRKNENALLVRDVYDFDFVKRAFSFLKVGGVLVAITSTKWEGEKDIVDFYKNNNSIKFSFETKENEGFSGIKITVSMLKLTKLNNDLDNDLMEKNYYNDRTEELGELIKNNEMTIEDTKMKNVIQDKLDEVKMETIERRRL